MTVREFVNELTEPYVDWDLEVYVAVTDKPVKSGEAIIQREYKVDRCELFNPVWYENDRCQIILKSSKE